MKALKQKVTIFTKRQIKLKDHIINACGYKRMLITGITC